MSDSLQNKLAVLVVSCDNYSDLWKPFFELFWRFWPDCPFNVYLLSNEKIVKFPNVTNIAVGEDKSWSNNLLLALKQLREEYVLMYIEDLLFYKKIDNERIVELIEWFISSGGNYVRMNPSPGPDKDYNNLVGEISKGSIYRASTVMSVWKKSVLQELLNSEENAWEFEVYGTIRSDSYGKFYSTFEAYMPVLNGVIKGVWRRSIVKQVKSLDVELDLKSRRVMSFGESIVFEFFKRIRSKLLECFPAKYQRRIKELFIGKRSLYRIKK